MLVSGMVYALNVAAVHYAQQNYLQCVNFCETALRTGQDSPLLQKVCGPRPSALERPRNRRRPGRKGVRVWERGCGRGGGGAEEEPEEWAYVQKERRCAARREDMWESTCAWGGG